MIGKSELGNSINNIVDLEWEIKMHEVKTKLLVNGLDYIVEAFDRLHISEYDPRELKYVIRDLVSGVEILLKQFLVPEN